ncbi:unnamed protein product [Coffea canephora]|uniref:Uncharacterized protein n=1 Tax=Coffea canephora TaxID=49390 RepID=A0A068UWA7_COFCA|nr:unnamed protein product [Coffea canephora]
MSWELFCVPFLLERYILKEAHLSHVTMLLLTMSRLRPVILTLWNEFEAIEGADIMANIAQNPVLICVRLRVTTDNYLSLSTQFSSVILVSPIVQEAGNLRTWFQANKSDLTQMVHERSYANPRVLVPPVASSRISQISFIAQATKFASLLLHSCWNYSLSL